LAKAVLVNVIVKQCRFEVCSLAGADSSCMADLGNTLKDCLFERTEFRAAGLGHRGSRYQHWRFEKCDFRRASFIRPEIDEDELEIVDRVIRGLEA
jgi:uncharacterized protein YjbI with pentapeptide repeats